MLKKLLKIAEIATLPKSAWSPNYQIYLYQILIGQIEDLNEDCIKISRPYIFNFLKNKPLKIVTIWSVGLVHRFK